MRARPLLLRRWCLASVVALAAALAACDDEPRPTLLDLAGPEGRVLGPGPWRVEVASRATPTLHLAVDSTDYTAHAFLSVGDERYEAAIADVPLGTRVRYFVTAGGERLPPEKPRVFEVVALAAVDAAVPTGGPCRVAFRAPADGAVLSPADDRARQAGLQIAVVVETDLADGTPARLGVGERGYAGRASEGALTFEPVDLVPGAHRLVVEARNPPDGPPCMAEIGLRVSP